MSDESIICASGPTLCQRGRNHAVVAAPEPTPGLVHVPTEPQQIIAQPNSMPRHHKRPRDTRATKIPPTSSQASRISPSPKSLVTAKRPFARLRHPAPATTVRAPRSIETAPFTQDASPPEASETSESTGGSKTQKRCPSSTHRWATCPFRFRWATFRPTSHAHGSWDGEAPNSSLSPVASHRRRATERRPPAPTAEATQSPSRQTRRHGHIKVASSPSSGNLSPTLPPSV